ncbi:indole-3-glycerol phosphate synthase TrpC [Constantimarinum furrinae]|nr:indole-3-glycerol phosphate synthase TrpC [Constantimarinum furrinae]
MSILEKIVKYKHQEVEQKKYAFPVSLLESSVLFTAPTRSLRNALEKVPVGIIAEHKRRSPSKKIINDSLLVQDIAEGYQSAGAAGMSVLTDTNFFGGSLDDLLLARSVTSFPILRKEFIVDPYQIIESKAYGADAILLIAAVLSDSALKEFSELAQSLKLEVLLEVHCKEELNRALLPSVDMLGINNRNLKTFEVSTNTSKTLSEYIPEEFIKISESGINSVATIKELRDYGFRGFLIGEQFMKAQDPGNTAKEFINQLF